MDSFKFKFAESLMTQLGVEDPRIFMEALKSAAQKGDTNLLDTLHTEFPFGPPNLNQILNFACKYGHHAFVSKLLTLYPRDVSEEINNHCPLMSPIHLAVLNGHTEVVAVLLKGVYDKRRFLKWQVDGWNSFHMATAKSDIPTMKILFSACREAVGELTDERESCLHLAARFNNLEAFKLVAEWLRELGLEHLSNQQDRKGDTVLHLATLCQDREFLRTLLNSNMPIAKEPRINTRNNNVYTALDLFYTYSNEVDNDIKQQLLAAGAATAKQLLPVSSQMGGTGMTDLLTRVSSNQQKKDNQRQVKSEVKMNNPHGQQKEHSILHTPHYENERFLEPFKHLMQEQLTSRAFSGHDDANCGLAGMIVLLGASLLWLNVEHLFLSTPALLILLMHVFIWFGIVSGISVVLLWLLRLPKKKSFLLQIGVLSTFCSYTCGIAVFLPFEWLRATFLAVAIFGLSVYVFVQLKRGKLLDNDSVKLSC